jgi:methionyl-tRNA formyltransferase
VPALAALCAAGLEPVEVVSQPARPAGRGRRLQDPPVVEWARAHGLPVSQPESVREPAFVEQMRRLDPWVAVVVAFGQIFPQAVLEIPERGCINLHASLLPRYRGAAPIQAAIIDGRTSTGVTTMQMDEGLDSGPILMQERVDIGPRETAGELAERLAEIGAQLMVRTLRGLASGELQATPQAHAEASLAPRLRKSDGELDWRHSATRLFNRIRGVTPWPGAFTLLRQRPLKVLSATVEETEVAGSGCLPGTYLGLVDGRMAVSCGERSVLGLQRLQRPGKKPLDASLFVNGEAVEAGDRFG